MSTFQIVKWPLIRKLTDNLRICTHNIVSYTTVFNLICGRILVTYAILPADVSFSRIRFTFCLCVSAYAGYGRLFTIRKYEPFFMFKTHICNRPNFSIFMENRDKKNFFLSLFLFVKSGCACVENSRGAVKNVQFIADGPTTQPTPRAQDSFIRFKNLIHNTTRTIVSVTQ